MSDVLLDLEYLYYIFEYEYFVNVYFLILTIVICVYKMNRDGDTRFPWWVSDLRRNQEKFQDLEIIL